jgi:hypothetical protein
MPGAAADGDAVAPISWPLRSKDPATPRVGANEATLLYIELPSLFRGGFRKILVFGVVGVVADDEAPRV